MERPEKPAPDDATLAVPAVRTPTLRPPEWDRESPASAGSAALVESLRTPAVARRQGARADHAWQKARLQEARRAKDQEAERASATVLARWLSARGMELDTAIRLARRALALGADPTLRAELAQWLSAIGEHALSAADSKMVATTKTGALASKELLRAGEALGRAGDAAASADVLRSAAEADPSSPVASELLGSLAVWAPGAIRPEVGAAAFIEAAQRRARLHDAEGAFEDRLRAFDLAPADEGVAEGVFAALVARTRSGAADEVLRAHARARGDGGAKVHLRRIRDAISTGDVARALGAALDGRLDAKLEGPEAQLFDDVLTRAGLFDLLSARLEARAETVSPARRSAAYSELARLYAGALASPDRAVDAWIWALSEDPSNDDARTALRHHATSMHDPAPLVEALLRVASAEPTRSPEGRIACLRELAQVADATLADPSLALFAIGLLDSAGALSDADVRSAKQRLGPRVRLQDDALAQAEGAIRRAEEQKDSSSKIEGLRRLASLLRGRPNEVDRYVAVLAELSTALPEERGWAHALERVAYRSGRLDALEASLRSRAEGGTHARSEVVRARLGLSAIARRRGFSEGALAEAAPLLTQAPSHRGAASVVLTQAALLGDEGFRAEALSQLAGPLSPPLRAVLLSSSSSAWLASGDRTRARALAEQACQADPTMPRAVAALAAAVSGTRDRVSAVALERAAGVLVAGASLAEELAATLETLGEAQLAIAWTQRWLALRPGDARATAELLARSARAGDATRLADALSWVLTMPAPVDAVADASAQALRALAARDPAIARAVARRVADVLGPRNASVRSAVLDVAESSGDHVLAALVLERWLAGGAPAETRGDLLVRIAAIRHAQGDALGETRALVRALKEGAQPERVFAMLADVVAGGGSDAALSRLEARAEALVALGSDRAAEASEAWREVGAARWDLAADPPGAVRAWVRAAELEPKHGPARLVRDLFAFGGPERAISELLAYAEQRTNPRDASLVLTLSAMAALEAGKPSQAFDAAERAVTLDPARTEALALAERSADPSKAGARLDALYTIVAGAAKGSYGRRAAHYRGARQLERRGLTRGAAQHSIRAFEAVPALGMTYVLMCRLAERADATADAVTAMTRVAQQHADPYERAAWLKKAASISTTSEEGIRQRVDVLLRALHVRPDTATVRDVVAALSTLVREHGEDSAAAEMRLERASTSALRRLEGPEGARVAIAFAQEAMATFGAARLAVSALKRALDFDADVDEYAEMVPYVPALAAVERDAPTEGFSAHCLAVMKKPYANVGPASLRLAGLVARDRGDLAVAGELLVAAARRAPEDVALVSEAEAAVSASGDERLGGALLDAFPVARRADALLYLAEQRETEGDLGGAASVLERAFTTLELTPETRSSLRARLRDLYLRSGRRDALETLLTNELDRPEIEQAERLATSRELAQLLAARGDSSRALDVLGEAARANPDAPDLWNEIADVARQGGDFERLCDALARVASSSQDSELRVSAARELATTLESRGDLAGAAARWQELLVLSPNDRDALAAMERLAMSRGDYDALAEVLAQRISQGGPKEEVRVLRLRRAALLEQRLGRLEDARIELEKLLSEQGGDASATRFLADLHERLGAPLRAAPLWIRAFQLQPDPRERAELAARAAQAYLKGGDYREARSAIEQALLLTRTPRLLELRVDLERRSENPRGLAEALDELAIASMDPPERRADFLVEAARASAAVGDDLAALERAQRAARIAPSSAAAQLLARLFEYKGRGAGTPQEAGATIEELRRVSARVTPDQAPLHALLLAEALDVVHGQAAGMRELSARHAELGAAPLIALGMAERLARTSNFHAALPLFDAALGGELHGVRRRGSIALAAADAAYRVDDLDRAQRYLEEAATDPVTMATAKQRQAALAQSLRSRSDALVPDERRTLQELARRAVGTERARALAQLARLMAQNPAERPEADRVFGEAISAASLEPQLVLELEAERDSLRGAPRASSRPPPMPPPTPLPADAETPRAFLAASPSTTPPPLESSSDMPTPLAFPAAPRISGLPSTSDESQAVVTARPPPSVHEAVTAPPPPLVAEAIVAVEAQALSARVTTSSMPPDGLLRHRNGALLGNREGIISLRDAALLDRNYPYARALDHVLRATSQGGEPVLPPPLVMQREQPELIHRFLSRGAAVAVSEALGLVWDGASHLFRREAGTYGVTGLDRVSFGAVTASSRVYTSAARLLGATRTPLFQRRAAGAVSCSVALLSPPAVVLNGDPREETPELHFRLGAALLSALPEHALIFGLPTAQLASLLAAILVAFGPGGGPRPAPAVAVLAESLWQALPARAQRRLGELCGRADEFTPDRARVDSRRAVRRAGLFIAGHLPVALREVILEDALVVDRPLDAPDGLQAACSAHPAIADLVKLATSAEYADARWQSSDSRALRGRSSSGNLRFGG